MADSPRHDELCLGAGIAQLGHASGRWASSIFGGRLRLRVAAEQVLGRFSQCELLLSAGDHSLAMTHAATDLVVNVLGGTVLLSRDGQECGLATGSVAVVPRGTRHEWRVSSGAAHLLLTGMPGGLEMLLHACRDRAPRDCRTIARTFGTDLGHPSGPTGRPAADPAMAQFA